MTNIDVLNGQGKVVESIDLKDNFLTSEPNKQALFDAIIMQRASLRQGTHSTKNRSAVRGGGAKPWKQKGTGRARQGTIRAPQWKGGGIVFGPTPRSYGYKINRKVRKLALMSSLIYKYQEGRLIIIDDLKIEQAKTKTMVELFTNLSTDRKPLIVTPEYDDKLFLSTRNITGAMSMEVSAMNVLDIVNAHYLIMTKEAFSKIEEVFGQ